MSDAIKGKRVLLIANECLSKTSSNGRTMANLLCQIEPQNLAQFFIHGTPDIGLCAYSYRVTDADAVSSVKGIFKKYAKSGLIVASDNNSCGAKKSHEQRIKGRRNCVKLLLRHFIWRTEKWWNSHFESFLKEFSPDVILLQAGDAPFMMRTARKIARRFGARLLMYNSENYVLKRKLYSRAKKYSPAHLWLQAILRKEYKKMMQAVDFCVYITEHLEDCYQNKYPHAGRSVALYTTTAFPASESKFSEKEAFSVAYCGNLGVGRVPALVSFANVLAQVSEKAKLHICGSFVNDEDEALLTALPNVIYHGRVPYEVVVDLMNNVALVIHCENSERLENLKTAFSTKIADSLACGTPFLVYATREYPFVQYLERNDAAHIAETEEELASVLRLCVEDEFYRKKYLENAKALAENNHSLVVNAEKMKSIIEGK